MGNKLSRGKTDRTLWQGRIHEPFIFAALGVALTAGFGYAALLVGALALKIPLGEWWGAAVQAHGHTQLLGWLGLFVIGMGLYFLPKLGGTQLRGTDRAPYAFALLVAGIATHSAAQPALGFVVPASPLVVGARALWIASALFELVGFGLIASMFLSTHRAQGPIARGSPEWHVFPFVVTAFASLGLVFVLNLIATGAAVWLGSATLDPAWDTLIIQLMLYGLAIPMAFAFSARNLPLFLRLAARPREELRNLGYVYALSLALRVVPQVAALGGVDADLLDRVGDLGGILQSASILFFVWRLDLLRRHAPWTTDRVPNTRPDLDHLRKPTRKMYPDAAEFGRFELLVYSAYFWLVVVALMEIVRAGAALVGTGAAIPADAERHALTVGFITLLIFGMGVRLLPGFSHKRRVAYPALVFVTFILGNLAALLRVVPLFFPSSDLALVLFGSSGAVGWAAVACLAINVVRTLRT